MLDNPAPQVLFVEFGDTLVVGDQIVISFLDKKLRVVDSVTADIVPEPATALLLGASLPDWEARSLVEMQREIEKASRLPRRLVEELSRVTALAYHAWVEARAADDFGAFAPWLEQVVALKREEAAMSFASWKTNVD